MGIGMNWMPGLVIGGGVGGERELCYVSRYMGEWVSNGGAGIDGGGWVREMVAGGDEDRKMVMLVLADKQHRHQDRGLLSGLYLFQRCKASS